MTPEQRARQMLFGDPEWGNGHDLDEDYTHPESGDRISIRELTARYNAEDNALS